MRRLRLSTMREAAEEVVDDTVELNEVSEETESTEQ